MDRTHVGAVILTVASVALFVLGGLNYEPGSADWAWERIVLPALAGVIFLAIALVLELIRYASILPPQD